ncbi:MAG: GxxExxY protein [Phycisphaerae bacterium]|nr:GxxExxY protein [Phycisphaerae bacterium]
MEEDEVGNDDGSVVETGRRRFTLRDPLTFAIIGAAQKVHRTLGLGFKESTYQQALAVELAGREVAFVSQPEFDVLYEGVLCGKYQPDIVVENRVVLELKAVSSFAPEHFAQTVSYLRASGLSVALLINFGSKSLTWRRFQN